MNNEKLPGSTKKRESLNESRELTAEQHETANKNRERESTRENKAERLENARRETLEAVAKAEKENRKETEQSDPSPAERRKGPISKQEREKAFAKTMDEVQSHMSAPSRTFSKIIHNKAVEKTSEIVGNSVARPNAILSGAVCSFVLVLITYLVARAYGYQLSGTETIAAFGLGWVVGLVYDYFRLLIIGKDR